MKIVPIIFVCYVILVKDAGVLKTVNELIIYINSNLLT